MRKTDAAQSPMWGILLLTKNRRQTELEDEKNRRLTELEDEKNRRQTELYGGQPFFFWRKITR
jgi:hypothetical protein